MEDIIIYGAGKNGKKFYDFMQHLNLGDQIKSYKDKQVLSPNTLTPGDRIIIGATRYADEIEYEASKKECIVLPREFFSRIYSGG